MLAPAICKVPPVNTGPDAPLGPEARVQASAPEVFALKVRPEASSALPLEQTPKIGEASDRNGRADNCVVGRVDD
jgi:hypothetical protein